MLQLLFFHRIFISWQFLSELKSLWFLAFGGKRRSKHSTLWDLARATLSPDDLVSCDIASCKTGFNKAGHTSGSVLAAPLWDEQQHKVDGGTWALHGLWQKGQLCPEQGQHNVLKIPSFETCALLHPSTICCGTGNSFTPQVSSHSPRKRDLKKFLEAKQPGKLWALRGVSHSALPPSTGCRRPAPALPAHFPARPQATYPKSALIIARSWTRDLLRSFQPHLLCSATFVCHRRSSQATTTSPMGCL